MQFGAGVSQRRSILFARRGWSVSYFVAEERITIRKGLGGGVWESNPPFGPRRNESPALKAGKVTGPFSPPLVILPAKQKTYWMAPTGSISIICVGATGVLFDIRPTASCKFEMDRCA